MSILDSEGFAQLYDFIYLPLDFKHLTGFGYAFVNFVTSDQAQRAIHHFDGFTQWPVASNRVCAAVWSAPTQGLQAHIERYRDSPVMHEEVPQEFKPLILCDGLPVPFPPPSKKLRAPRASRMGCVRQSH